MNNPVMDIHAGFRLSDYMVDILKITGPLSRDQLDQFQNLIEIQQSKLNVLDMRRQHIEFLAQNHNNNKTKVTWQQPKQYEPSYTNSTSSENDGEKLMKAANILQDLLPKYFTRRTSNQETQTSPRESVISVNRTGIHTSERRLHDGVTQTEAFDPTVVFVEKMYIVMLSAVNKVQAQNEGVELFLQCCLEEIRKFQPKPGVGTNLGKENELDNFEIGMENVLLTSLESMRSRRQHDDILDERHAEYEYEESLHMETVMEVINDMVCHDVRNEDIAPSRTVSVPTTFEYNSEFELNKSWSHPSTLSYYESETARPFNWTADGKVETLGDSDTDDEYFRDKLIVPKLDLTFLKELEPVELSSHDSDSSFWSIDLTEKGFKKWLEAKGIYVSNDPEAEKAEAQQNLRNWKSDHSLNIKEETDNGGKDKTRKSKSMAEASQVTTVQYSEATEPYGHGDVQDVLSVIYEEDYLPEHVEKTGITETECIPVSDRTHQARIEKAQKAIGWVDTVNEYLAKNEMISIPDVGDGYLTDDACTDISDCTSSSSDIIPPPMMKSDDDIQSHREANDKVVETGEYAKMNMALENITEPRTEEDGGTDANSGDGSISDSLESIQMHVNSDSELSNMAPSLETGNGDIDKSLKDTYFTDQDESCGKMKPITEKAAEKPRREAAFVNGDLKPDERCINMESQTEGEAETTQREAESVDTDSEHTQPSVETRSESSSYMTSSSESIESNKVQYTDSKTTIKKDEMKNKEEQVKGKANTTLSETDTENNSLDSMQRDIHSYAESLHMSSFSEPKNDQDQCNKNTDKTLIGEGLAHQACQKVVQDRLSKIEDQHKMSMKTSVIENEIESGFSEKEQENPDNDKVLSQGLDLRALIQTHSNNEASEVPTDTESDEDFITGCMSNIIRTIEDERKQAIEDDLSDESCSLDIPTIPPTSPSYFMRANKIDSDRTESSFGSYHEADIVTLGSWDTGSMEECLFLKYSKKNTSTDVTTLKDKQAKEEENVINAPSSGNQEVFDSEQEGKKQSETQENLLVHESSHLAQEDINSPEGIYGTDNRIASCLETTQNSVPATPDVWVDENDIEVIDIESMEHLTPVIDNREVMSSPQAKQLSESDTIAKTTTNRSPVNQSPDYADVPGDCDDCINGEITTVTGFYENNDSCHAVSDDKHIHNSDIVKTDDEIIVETESLITKSYKTEKDMLDEDKQNVMNQGKETDDDIESAGSWDNDDSDENGDDDDEHENVTNEKVVNYVVNAKGDEKESVNIPIAIDNKGFDLSETNDTKQVHGCDKGFVNNENDKTEKLHDEDKLNAMNQGEETDEDIESAGSWDNDDSDENGDDDDEHENVTNEKVVNYVVNAKGDEKESVNIPIAIDNKGFDLSETNDTKQVHGCDKGFVNNENDKTEKLHDEDKLNAMNQGEETDEDIESAGSWDNNDSDENDDDNEQGNVANENVVNPVVKTNRNERESFDMSGENDNNGCDIPKTNGKEINGDECKADCDINDGMNVIGSHNTVSDIQYDIVNCGSDHYGDENIVDNESLISYSDKTEREILDKDHLNDRGDETDVDIESVCSWDNDDVDENEDKNEQENVKNQGGNNFVVQTNGNETHERESIDKPGENDKGCEVTKTNATKEVHDADDGNAYDCNDGDTVSVGSWDESNADDDNDDNGDGDIKMNMAETFGKTSIDTTNVRGDTIRNKDIVKKYNGDKRSFSEVLDLKRDIQREQCGNIKSVTFADNCIIIEPDDLTDSSTQVLQSDHQETSINMCTTPELVVSKGTNSMYNGALIIKDVESGDTSDDCSVIDMPESELVRWQSKRNETADKNNAYFTDPSKLPDDLDVRFVPETSHLATDQCLVKSTMGNQLNALPHKLGPLKPIVNTEPVLPIDECNGDTRGVGLSYQEVSHDGVPRESARNYLYETSMNTGSQSFYQPLPKPKSLGPLQPVGKMVQSLPSNDQMAISAHGELAPLAKAAKKLVEHLQPIKDTMSNQLSGNPSCTIRGRKDLLAPLVPLNNQQNTEKKKVKKESKTKEKKKKKQTKSQPTKVQEERRVEVNGSSSTESFSMPSFEVADDIFEPSVDRLEDDFIRNSSESSSVDSFRRKVVNISRGAAPMDDDFEIGSYESSNESYGGDKNYNSKTKVKFSDHLRSSKDKTCNVKKCTMNIYQSYTALPGRSELPNKDQNGKKNTVVPENEPRSRSSIKPVEVKPFDAISHEAVQKTVTSYSSDLNNDNYIPRSSMVSATDWVPKNRIWEPLRLENGRLRHAWIDNELSQSNKFVKGRIWEPLQVVNGRFSSVTQFKYIREPQYESEIPRRH